MKRSFYALAAFSLVIASCGGTADSTTTTEAVETTTTAATASSSSSTAEATTSTAGPDATGGGDSCLYGDWVLDNDAFIDTVFSNLGGAAGLGEASAAGGTNTITFDADGSLTTARDDWGFVIESDQGSFKILISGEQTGTWATSGDVLSISLEEGPPPEITTSLVVDGQEVSLPQAPFEVPAEALGASSEYRCNGGAFSVTTDEFTSTFNRP